MTGCKDGNEICRQVLQEAVQPAWIDAAGAGTRLEAPGRGSLRLCALWSSRGGRLRLAVADIWSTLSIQQSGAPAQHDMLEKMWTGSVYWQVLQNPFSQREATQQLLVQILRTRPGCRSLSAKPCDKQVAVG